MATPGALDKFTPAMERLLGYARVCRVASAGPRGPHVGPLCHAFDGDRTVYIETQPSRLTVRNLAHSPEVVLLVDDYVEDWSKLWMLSLTGKGRALTEGAEFDKAVSLLRQKFPQFDGGGLTVGFVLAIDLTGVRHSEGVVA